MQLIFPIRVSMRSFVLILACCASALSIFVASQSGDMTMTDEEFEKMLDSKFTNMDLLRPPSPWNSLNEQLGYDKAFQAEINDGLIALDFRKVSAPSFEKWKFDRRDFQNRTFQNNNANHGYFDFTLYLNSATLYVTLRVTILDSYDSAHDFFRTIIEEIASTMFGPRMYHAWRPCERNIGTACARTAISAVFSYKNVRVNIETRPILPENDPLHKAIGEWTDEALIPKSPNGGPWDMVIAEWVFDTLKTAPRFKEFPVEPVPTSESNIKN